MRRLDGKVVVVTGASRGIGAEIAKLCAAEGGKVVCAARTLREGDHPLAGSLEMTVGQIRAAGGEATPVAVNIAEPADCERLLQTARATYGPVDVLVNNAGFNRRRKTFMEIDLASWHEVLAGNLTAPMLLSQAVVPDMARRGWGRIINVGAVQAWMPLEGNAAYAASKGGLVSLTRSMAVDLTRAGIVVNAIAPGPVDPQAEDEPRDQEDWPTLLGRRGLPREVAGLASFLASDECTFIVGQTIVCDGGRLFSRKPDRA